MRNVLSGFKRGILSLSLLLLFQIFLVGGNYASAEKLDSAKVCEKYGGAYTAVGCVINETGVGGSQTLRSDSNEIDAFYVLDNNNFSCPSGYRALTEPSYTKCMKSGGSTDTEDRQIQAKNTVDSAIESLKNRDEYNKAGQSLNDDDWKNIKETCKSKTGQEATECVTKAANEKAKAKESALTQESSNNDENKTNCAVEWLGWIVCPTARLGTQFVVGIWGVIKDNFLTIKAKTLFSDGGDSNDVFKFWKIFRDIANVFFAIFVAIVIGSQVTGIGISNYGIKKMLPRLIIFAILVNASYWLTVLLVDLSNIVGSSLSNFLIGSSGWDAAAEGEGGLVSVVEGFLTGAAIAAAGYVIVFAGGWLMMLAAVALAAVMIISVLALREAMVIVLIVVSPIALASAILPNTEGFFNKWKNLFKSMLVIYPVCAVTIGGVILASNILYSVSDNPFMKAIYGLLPLLGFYAIIGIIKGALVAIDKLTGGSISKTLGSLQDKAMNRARNSSVNHWAKNNMLTNSRFGSKGFERRRAARMDNAKRRGRMAEAQAIQRQFGEKDFNKLNPSQQRQLVSAQQAIAKEDMEEIQLAGSYLANQINTGVMSKEEVLNRAFSSGDAMTQKQAVYAVMSSAGGMGGKVAALNNVVSGLSNDTVGSKSFKDAMNFTNTQYGKDIKNSSVSMSEFVSQNARGGGAVSMASLRSDINTWSGMDAETLATQSDTEKQAIYDAQGIAMSSNNIDSQKTAQKIGSLAQDVMNSDKLSVKASTTKAETQQIASYAPSQAASTQQTTTTSAGGGQPAPVDSGQQSQPAPVDSQLKSESLVKPSYQQAQNQTIKVETVTYADSWHNGGATQSQLQNSKVQSAREASRRRFGPTSGGGGSGIGYKPNKKP